MQSHDFEFTRRGDGKDYAMTSSDNTACVAIRSWSNSFVEQFVRGAVRSWSTSFGSSSFGSSLFGSIIICSIQRLRIEREEKPVPAKSLYCHNTESYHV